MTKGRMIVIILLKYSRAKKPIPGILFLMLDQTVSLKMTQLQT